jgi:hypothetical protein
LGLASSVVYLSAYTAGVKGLDPADEAWFKANGKRSSASDCDDTPMGHVGLPFAVPYGGQRFRHVFLNPNGMVFFTKRPPCDSWFSAGPPCSFDSQPWGVYQGYLNLIAVFGSDFNPADSEDSVIMYAVNEEKVIASWENLNMFGSDWMGFHFSVEIRASGHVALYLSSVLFPSQVPDAPAWITDDGVLVALRFAGEQLNRTYVTPEQTAHRTDWLKGTDGGSSGTGVDGIYPPKAQVHNYTRLDYCPVPTRMCLSPKDGDTSDRSLELSLSTPDNWGCDDDVFAFRCSLSDVTGVAPALVSPATVVRNGTGSGATVVTCGVGNLSLVGSTDYAVTLHFAPFQDAAPDSAAWQGVPSPFEPPLFRAHDHPTGETCGYGGDSSGVCDACGVCGGQSGCVGCDARTVGAEYDCKGACDGDQGLWATDRLNNCCDMIHGADCLGTCGGTYRQGWVSDMSYQVCCAKVDCARFCNGKAEVDSCDVCSGGNSGHEADSDKDCTGTCFGNATCAPTAVSTPSSFKRASMLAHMCT